MGLCEPNGSTGGQHGPDRSRGTGTVFSVVAFWILAMDRPAPDSMRRVMLTFLNPLCDVGLRRQTQHRAGAYVSRGSGMRDQTWPVRSGHVLVDRDIILH